MKYMRLLLFIGIFPILSSCTFTVYSSDESVKVYEDITEEGRYTWYFLPDNLFLFSKSEDSRQESFILEAKGTSATNIFGPMYNVTMDNELFGWRYYPDAKEVWLMNFEVLYNSSSDKGRSLPERGERFRQVIIDNGKSIKVNNSHYTQRELNRVDRAMIELSFPSSGL
jgi:hypothetical protein